MRQIDFRSPWPWLNLAALVVSITFILYPLLNILTASFGSGGQNVWVQLLHNN